MNLTPLDIRRKEFDKGFRGYDPTEVDLFLKQVAQQMEELQEEVRRAGERARDAEAKLTHYEKVELALQEALESARETARSTAASSEEKARLIVQDAELRADTILRDAERERHGLRQDIVRLSSRQAEAAARLRGFLMSELEVLAQFQGDEPSGFLRLQPATPPGGYSSSPARLEAPMSEDPEPWDDDTLVGQDPSADAASAWTAPSQAPEPSAPEPAPYEAPAPSAYDASAYDPSAYEPTPPAYEPTAYQPPAPEPTPYEPPAPEPAQAPDAFSPAPAPFGPADAPPADGSGNGEPVKAPGMPMTGAYSSAPERPAEETVEEPADEPPSPPAVTGGWDLRSLVTGEERSVVASDEERDRIRRILDDLD